MHCLAKKISPQSCSRFGLIERTVAAPEAAVSHCLRRCEKLAVLRDVLWSSCSCCPAFSTFDQTPPWELFWRQKNLGLVFLGQTSEFYLHLKNKIVCCGWKSCTCTGRWWNSSCSSVLRTSSWHSKMHSGEGSPGGGSECNAHKYLHSLCPFHASVCVALLMLFWRRWNDLWFVKWLRKL